MLAGCPKLCCAGTDWLNEGCPKEEGWSNVGDGALNEGEGADWDGADDPPPPPPREPDW